MHAVTDIATRQAARRAEQAARRDARRQVADALRQIRAAIVKLCAEATGLPHLVEVERAQLRAIAALAGIDVANLSLDPDADDIRAVGDNLEAIAAAVDPLIATIGDTLNSRTGGVDVKLFRTPLKDALEGFALYEVESAAEQIEANGQFGVGA